MAKQATRAALLPTNLCLKSAIDLVLPRDWLVGVVMLTNRFRFTLALSTLLVKFRL